MDKNTQNDNNNIQNEKKDGYTPMTDAQIKKARRISTIITSIVAVIVLVLLYLKKNGTI